MLLYIAGSNQLPSLPVTCESSSSLRPLSRCAPPLYPFKTPHPIFQRPSQPVFGVLSSALSFISHSIFASFVAAFAPLRRERCTTPAYLLFTSRSPRRVGIPQSTLFQPFTPLHSGSPILLIIARRPSGSQTSQVPHLFSQKVTPTLVHLSPLSSVSLPTVKPLSLFTYSESLQDAGTNGCNPTGSCPIRCLSTNTPHLTHGDTHVITRLRLSSTGERARLAETMDDIFYARTTLRASFSVFHLLGSQYRIYHGLQDESAYERLLDL